MDAANPRKAVAHHSIAPTQEKSAVHLALVHLDGDAAVLELAIPPEVNAARMGAIVNLETNAFSYEASMYAVRILTVQHTFLGALLLLVLEMAITALRGRSRQLFQQLIRLLSPALDRAQPPVQPKKLLQRRRRWPCSSIITSHLLGKAGYISIGNVN